MNTEVTKYLRLLNYCSMPRGMPACQLCCPALQQKCRSALCGFPLYELLRSWRQLQQSALQLNAAFASSPTHGCANLRWLQSESCARHGDVQIVHLGDHRHWPLPLLRSSANCRARPSRALSIRRNRHVVTNVRALRYFLNSASFSVTRACPQEFASTIPKD